MMRRLKWLPLTAQFLREWEEESNHYWMSLPVLKVLRLFERIIKSERLPPDVAIEQAYYDPRYGCWCLLLWSEVFPIVKDGEMAPLCSI